MKNYPNFLSYEDWFEKYFVKLPRNIFLKIIYFPIYIVGSLIAIFTDGLGLIVFYIALFPVYLIYLLFYYLKKITFSNMVITLVLDDQNIKNLYLKEIKNPEREGMRFLGWELENKSKVSDLWKLKPGTKIFAIWENLKGEKHYNNDSVNAKVFYLKLSGLTIGNRQKNIGNITINQELIYERESSNPYDKNAILIKTKDGLELGYIPKANNKKMAQDIDNGFKFRIRVANITGTSTQNRGVNILIDPINQDQKNNFTTNVVRPNKSTTNYSDSIDLNLYENFENDEIMNFDKSFAERDDDGGYEPESNNDFDPFDSDF